MVGCGRLDVGSVCQRARGYAGNGYVMVTWKVACFIGGGVRERSENLTRAVSARELEVLWASRYGREAQERLRSAVPAPSTRAR